jgi:hypothetical protein
MRKNRVPTLGTPFAHCLSKKPPTTEQQWERGVRLDHHRLPVTASKTACESRKCHQLCTCRYSTCATLPRAITLSPKLTKKPEKITVSRILLCLAVIIGLSSSFLPSSPRDIRLDPSVVSSVMIDPILCWSVSSCFSRLRHVVPIMVQIAGAAQSSGHRLQESCAERMTHKTLTGLQATGLDTRVWTKSFVQPVFTTLTQVR